MADPGQFNYFLTGKDVFFINSNDNKIIIRSEKPIATVADLGIVRPSTGSLTAASTAPTLIGSVIPSTASLVLDGKQVGQHTVTPTLGTLAFDGSNVATLAIKVFPPSKSLVLTEFIGARFTGLWFEGFAPLAKGGVIVAPTVGVVTLSGKVPDRFVTPPASHIRVPPTKPVTLAGIVPVAASAHVVQPLLGGITTFGRLVFINDVVFPGRATIAATGFAPIPGRSGGEVSVIIEGPFNYGTFIRNDNATFDSKHRFEICQRSGFKQKVRKGYPLVEDYTGIHTRVDSVDPPVDPQDRVQQTKTRYKQGSIRPEPVGSETFIETDIDPDDL